MRCSRWTCATPTTACSPRPRTAWPPFLEDLAAESGTGITSRRLARFAPVEFAPDMIDRVERVAGELGLSHRRLCSGAGHDAQMFAPVCPTSMIFVPSWEGISHNPFEHTEPEHLEAGANVLLRVMLELAEVAETSEAAEKAGAAA